MGTNNSMKKAPPSSSTYTKNKFLQEEKKKRKSMTQKSTIEKEKGNGQAPLKRIKKEASSSSLDVTINKMTQRKEKCIVENCSNFCMPYQCVCSYEHLLVWSKELLGCLITTTDRHDQRNQAS